MVSAKKQATILGSNQGAAGSSPLHRVKPERASLGQDYEYTVVHIASGCQKPLFTFRSIEDLQCMYVSPSCAAFTSCIHTRCIALG